jgi:hypothetical protein
MLKSILFSLLFILLGLVVFSLLAPILFHGSDMRQLGAASFPFIAIGCGVAGFLYGRAQSRKK